MSLPFSSVVVPLRHLSSKNVMGVFVQNLEARIR